MSKPTIGLVLGGGGVRGLAHIAVLELFDEMHIRPVAMAGCSMGAVVGALYASGMSGGEIRTLVEKHTVLGDDGLRDVIRKGSSLIKWVTGIVPEIHHGGLINVDRFFSYLLEPLEDMSFDELSIPLVVVATDFWAAQCVTLRQGPVLPAVRASMSVPGVFSAVSLDGKVLVDGGLVNHLPYEQIAGECDVVVAVDVSGERRPGRRETPGALDAILGGMDIMQTAALNQRLKSHSPDILVRPRIRDVEMLEVTKIDAVLEQSRESIDELRTRLAEVMDGAA